jgi:hypothetical protein
MTDPEQPQPQVTPKSLGRERYDDEQPTRAKNSKRILESNRTLTLDDENKSGKGAEESLGLHSQTRGTGNRRGLLKRFTGFPARSLHGRTSMRDGGKSADGGSKPTLRSSPSNRGKNRNVNQQGVRKGLSYEALQRPVDRLGNQSSRTGDEPSNGVDNTDFLLDSTETDDSSNFLDGHDGEEVPSNAAGSSIEGRWVDDFQELEQPKEGFTANTVNTGQNRHGLVLPKSVAGARPTLRRTMSTPSLQSHQPSLRSILKKCDPLSSTQPRESSDLSVQFDSVEMREFNRTIGDNPSVSRGVPISLGWNYNPTPIIQSVDEYEMFREPRRSKNELALPPSTRADILNGEWGIPLRELQETISETNHIRTQRWQTARQDPIQQRREELLETAKRRLGRAFHGGKKKELKQLMALGVTDAALEPITVAHDEICPLG